MSRPILLNVLVLNLIFCCGSILRGDDLVLSQSGVGLARIKTVLHEAVEQGMWVTQLQVVARGNRISFDYVVEENTDDTPWFYALNATDERLWQAEQKFADQDYSRFIEERLEVNGHGVSSVVWRKVSLPVPLVLPSAATPDSGPVQELTRSLDDAVKRFLVQHNVAGATVAVGVRDQLVYSRGFGYRDVSNRLLMRPDTEMRIASISKTITGAAVVKLVEQGRLTFDDELLPFLTATGFLLPDEIDKRWERVTVRQLLTHCGGWDRDESGDPMFQAGRITRTQKLRQPATCRDVIQYQLSQPLDFEPGAHASYSNLGYLLLGQVVEAVTGQKYESAIHRLVLQPARMMSTCVGKTRVEDRGEHEAMYHMQNMTTHRPFWSFVDRRQQRLMTLVSAPDGRWDLQQMAAAAGWVSTAADMVRLASAIGPSPVGMGNGFQWGQQLEGYLVKNPTLDIVEVCQLGSLAGSSSLLFRTADGLVCSALFNTDESVHGRPLAELFLPVICPVIADIKEWPRLDLFAAQPKAASLN